MTGDEQILILLDDGRYDRVLIFERPVGVICCRDAGEVDSALAELEGARRSGLHAAGFMAYELGYALEPRLQPLLPAAKAVPLIWFGLFEAPRVLEGRAVAAILHERTSSGHRLTAPSALWDHEAYAARFNRVQNYIAAGDVYQVNLTFPLSFRMAGDPLSLYAALRARQPVSHGGFIRTPEFSILSLSPELFVEGRNGALTSRPMKGTAPRIPGQDDGDAARALRSDEKSRAENLMIVDLIRNDLSRVTIPGTVKVPDLYTVETYPGFLALTSTVSGRLRDDAGIPEIIRALFPCGSVTGAPKIRAQQIIHELEGAPRGVYTGSIGHIAPSGDFAFNVAIRTAHIEADGTGTMGIGSGLVRDSDCASEYDECLLKARFLSGAAETFRLIETLLWHSGSGFHWLAEHLERLAASAAHFAFEYEESAVRAELDGCAANLPPGPHLVRLLLDENGGMEADARPITPPAPGEVWRYAISPERIQSCDPFRRHKTTRRRLYDSEHARLTRETGCDEVLFLNERGELAEGSRTTVFLRRGETLYTPPLDCGALDGVLRRVLMRDPAIDLREEVLYPEDLQMADEVLLGNSVRGLNSAIGLSQTSGDTAWRAKLPRS